MFKEHVIVLQQSLQTYSASKSKRLVTLSEFLMQMGESPRSTIAPEFNGSSQTEASVQKKSPMVNLSSGQD